jgi:hypothetical protein
MSAKSTRNPVATFTARSSQRRDLREIIQHEQYLSAKELPSPWKIPESCGSDDLTKALFMTTQRASIEYVIVAVAFHADAATHDELARKVNEQLRAGYELVGAPFLSEDMMYQAMTRLIAQTSPLTTA